MSVVMMAICAATLAFDKAFAIDFIAKNTKTFVTAMLFASIAIIREFLDAWSAPGEGGD
jgi:hypothetical protein